MIVWDAVSGDMSKKHALHPDREVLALAWSPDGRFLVAGGRFPEIVIHDFKSDANKVVGLNAARVFGLAWLPDGMTLAVGGGEIKKKYNMCLLTLATGEITHYLNQHEVHVGRLVFLPDGRLVSASSDKTLGLWDKGSGNLIKRLKGHTAEVPCVSVSRDGKILASSSFDKTIRTWDADTGLQTGILEGHGGSVYCISFSPDGSFIASYSIDQTIGLWQVDTLSRVGEIKFASLVGNHFSSLEFHPKKPLLAAIVDDGSAVHIWDIETGVLLGEELSLDAVRYANAKIVLAGDTGVGKTGLSNRLVQGRFEPTVSTHGRRVMTLETRTMESSAGVPTTQETLLWDLAGQPGYRLVHQLQMDDAAVALVLFDARSETDPFGSSAYWSHALDQARSNAGIVKFLVASRTDRGGVGISRERIRPVREGARFSGILPHQRPHRGRG